MSQRDTLIHLVSGGVAGTAGAVVTCPLEVVKTRLQSSNPTFGTRDSANKSFIRKLMTKNNSLENGTPLEKSAENAKVKQRSGSRSLFTCTSCKRNSQILTVARASDIHTTNGSKLGLMKCLRLIIEKEGPRALFRGLGPNLVGVAPSRAIYFCSYSQSKKTYNQIFPADSPVVHIFSAATAGFVASTATNPIWFVKTRLQLDSHGKKSTFDTIRNIYRTSGIRGFYKGMTASYMGISETVIHFVIYEAVKKRLQDWSHSGRSLADEEKDEKSTSDFFQFMIAGAFSKTVATCIAYPHEVARTRLREEGSKYRHFWQTLSLVFKEEGYRGLYRGLATQLIRQIPNTAIMMSTYEATVYLLNKYVPESSSASMRSVEALAHDNSYDESYRIEQENE